MDMTWHSDAPDSFQHLEQEPAELVWSPICQHDCAFPPEIFTSVMRNLIQNPNNNSNHLFRADIKLERPYVSGLENTTDVPLRFAVYRDFELLHVIVCTLIPRNSLVDKPIDETCLFHRKVSNKENSNVVSMVTYLPHISTASEAPFYYPAVHGIAFQHEYSATTRIGKISLHYSFFSSESCSPKLERVAQHLLGVLYKHGQGTFNGYVKRVHHDIILPQSIVQNTYSRLKAKYAKRLIKEWTESTDPTKHVFEDLGIAAFLIELWAQIYRDRKFPGFVDIGCGNGLLVYILSEEGYPGWGFDARRRKSWSKYSKPDDENLKELILVPSIIHSEPCSRITSAVTPGEAVGAARINQVESIGLCGEVCPPKLSAEEDITNLQFHDGLFTNNPFIISNHADELTPWTPLLATLSRSPFMMIPCCSHDFSGKRFRASYPGEKTAPKSAYASLVAWVSQISSECGWRVEKEMLRIPSTRNTALIGRVRTLPYQEINLKQILENHGGGGGWEENVLKLARDSTRNH